MQQSDRLGERPGGRLKASECLVVCGKESSIRIQQSVLPHLDFDLEVVNVEFKEDFVRELAGRQPPLAVVEWKIDVFASVKDEAALLADGVPPLVAAMPAGSVMETIPAHAVFDEASAASPNTRFIIACHNRGYDYVKDHEDEFMKHPAAIKRMGFINGLVNMRYLAKLFTRTYTGRTWKETF